MSLTCAPSSSFILEITTALSSLFAVGCGGVGWDKNAHVPVHTQEPQPHHLSYSGADTGTDGGAVDEIMMMMMMMIMIMIFMGVQYWSEV